MRREGRRARSRRPQFVFDRFGQLRHRHARNDERRGGRHRLLDGRGLRVPSPPAPPASSPCEARSRASSRCGGGRIRGSGRDSAPSRPRRDRLLRQCRVEPRPRATCSNVAKPSSVSLTTTSSPCGLFLKVEGRRTCAGTRRPGLLPGLRNAPATQPFAYEASPKFGICRSTPVRYSRSADGARKRTSTSSASIRSASRRCRSA